MSSSFWLSCSSLSYMPEIIHSKGNSSVCYILARFQKWVKGSRQVANIGPTVLHSCFCSLFNVSKKQLDAPPNNAHENSTTSEERNFTKQIKALIFLKGSFSIRNNGRTTFHFRRERQSKHFKI